MICGGVWWVRGVVCGGGGVMWGSVVGKGCGVWWWVCDVGELEWRVRVCG